MSRFRLLPAPAQEAVLRDHCGHARYVWNLAIEQHAHWRTSRKAMPGYLEQCRQLTRVRAENPWLAVGSQAVKQQALRDLTRAMAAFFDPGDPAGWRTRRRAGWRRSDPRSRASGARRAGTRTRSRGRANRGSCARPAVSPATRI